MKTRGRYTGKRLSRVELIVPSAREQRRKLARELKKGVRPNPSQADRTSDGTGNA